MTLDGTDGHGVVYEPVSGPARKIEFEPRSDGRFERIEAEWNGCQWRVTGREVVESVREA